MVVTLTHGSGKYEEESYIGENTVTKRHHLGWKQGSHRNVIIKLHDVSTTIYTVFYDAGKANTEDHSYTSPMRKETQISFQIENKKSKRWVVSCLTL